VVKARSLPAGRLAGLPVCVAAMALRWAVRKRAFKPAREYSAGIFRCSDRATFRRPWRGVCRNVDSGCRRRSGRRWHRPLWCVPPLACPSLSAPFLLPGISPCLTMPSSSAMCGCSIRFADK
jgi:hypothetical protein